MWPPTQSRKKSELEDCKGLYSQSYGFSSSHVWMWELDYKEGWALKNWYSRIVVLEKTLKSPLDVKEIKPVNSKRNHRTHWRLLDSVMVLLHCSFAKSCPTLCHPMNCSTPGFPGLHCLLKAREFAQTHVHWISNAIQPSHPLSPHSPPALNLPQHQGLFQWGSSSHQVAKVLELQLQH